MRIVFTFFLSIIATLAIAQSITWSAPVSIAPNTYDNDHPRIVLDRSGNPMVLWGTSTMKAAFSKWNGAGFSTPSYITNTAAVFTASWAGPDIASYGDTVYVVVKYDPEQDTNSHTYLLRSFDGGQSFLTPVRVDYISDSFCRFPAVTTDDMGNPVVAFMKFKNNSGDSKYVVARSTDFGTSFMTDKTASAFNGEEVCDCCPGTVLSSGNKTVMLYRNNANNLRTIWAGISLDTGNTFSGLQIDNTNWLVNACPSSGPDGVILGDTLYSVFRSSASGTRIYTSKSSLSNSQLVSCSPYAPTFPIVGSQDYPRIANDGNAAVMVWKEVMAGKSRACITVTPNIQAGFPASYDTIASSYVNNIDVAIRGDQVHVVWENTSTGTVTYRRGTINTANSVSVIDEAPSIAVFPNPAAKEITIPISNIASCTITDAVGRTYVATPISTNGQTRVSVAHLIPGTYVATWLDSKGKKLMSRIVIN
jgi:hypothetical protein